MKKFLLLAVAFLFFIPPMPLVAAETEPAPYVALGDSIAAGYRLKSPDEAYPSLLAKDLGLALTNLAKNGQTSTEMKEHILSLSDEEKELVSQAKLITISIGGNDLIGEENRLLVLAEALISVITGDYSMSENMKSIYATLKSNLTESISTLRALNPDAVIILQTLYNPYLISDYTYGGYNIGDQLDFYIREINRTYDEVLKETGGFVLADTASAMNGIPLYFYSDVDFHPTAAGHAVIADVLANTYREIIDEKTPPAAETTTEAETTLPQVTETTATEQSAMTAETPQPTETSALPQTSAETAAVIAPAETTPDSSESTAPSTTRTESDTSAMPVSLPIDTQTNYGGIVGAIVAVCLGVAALFLLLRGLGRGKLTS